jgi:hypothetical protein
MRHSSSSYHFKVDTVSQDVCTARKDVCGKQEPSDQAKAKGTLTGQENTPYFAPHLLSSNVIIREAFIRKKGGTVVKVNKSIT